MPIKARPETLAMITAADKEALMAIYRHRCLDEPLLHQYFYSDKPEDFTLARLREFNAEGLLDIVEYSGSEYPAIFLSSRGIQTLRELYEIPSFTVDKETGKKRSEITRAANLKMPEILLNHQMHLSAFALAIESRIKGRVPYEYQDNKFIDACTYAQPDGIFVLPNCDLFLEMDMAHERQAELRTKWGHYRNYLSARERYLKRPKKIVVLFATENLRPGGMATRRKSVLASLSKTIFDLFCEDFECYIGTSAELVKIAAQLALEGPGLPGIAPYLSSEMGFKLSRPTIVRDACRESYLYMRQLSEKGGVLIQDGRPQNFFLEDYTQRPVSVLKRAASFSHTASLLQPVLKREVPLLLLCPDERSIYQDMASVDALGTPGVYCTTEERLRGRPFPEALFRFDQLGKMYHFDSPSLKNEIFEKTK